MTHLRGGSPMKNGRSGWEIAGDLTLKGVTVAVAAALFSLVWPAGVIDEDADGSADGALRTIASAPQCDTTRVGMKVREGKPFANYSLQDERGVELMRVTYVRTGDVVVKLGERFPARPGVSAKVDGTCSVSVEHGSVGYRLKIRPNGASGFSVADNPHGVRDGLGIDRDGNLARDPSIAD